MPRPPPLACDCHIHVFGPFARYPLDAARKYTPEEARLDDYVKMAAALGTGRVVLVQPSVYGVDNACQRDAMRELGERARGVAVIDGSVSDAQLGALNGAGFVGARLNFMRAGELESLERTAARVKQFGWHVQLHLPGAMIPEIADRLLKLPTDFVIDHFGRVDAWQGCVQPAFQELLRLVDSGRCWVKLSAPYRMDGAPYNKVAPLARELVKHNPERMVWGTDWPHPDVAVLPEDAGLLQTMFDWVPDAATRQRILVDNPAKLYRF
ncbi:MAG: amidohydrolase family protein [Betaproteobacteria bacterium]|nr:amidohydrolase family protein [Betaproteobacteria bacterium]MDH4322501.1 amidohydrolase family protein [Betaproteobacteria bacterium]MDH5577260.1 amidohydrolase family protein [Betaproteobacteria bacterium]